MIGDDDELQAGTPCGLRDLVEAAAAIGSVGVDVVRATRRGGAAIEHGRGQRRGWQQREPRERDQRNEEGGKPFSYLISYVAPRAGAYASELENVVGPFYAHLAQRTGEEILGAEQDLHGAPMPAEISSHLQVKAGTIGMCALRRYLTKKGTLVATYNWHVAEKFHYRMKMSRDV
ncbi:MAG: UTRA domain-containing protein [Acidobacteriota bacterium]|nr:UTRA domain-containing protein [Acidobacteriota bacterium]